MSVQALPKRRPLVLVVEEAVGESGAAVGKGAEGLVASEVAVNLATGSAVIQPYAQDSCVHENSVLETRNIRVVRALAKLEEAVNPKSVEIEADDGVVHWKPELA